MPVIDENKVEEIRQRLFADDESNVFVVLDGASIPDLRMRLFDLEPEHACLFRGELSPDLAEAAPYLVKLDADDPFTNWVLADGWGQHWGIFAVSKAGMRAMRTHFRRLMTVRDPDGKELHFRFYDPRVLSIFLRTCDEAQIEEMFGEVDQFAYEAPGNDGTAEMQLSVVDRQSGW